MSKTFLPETIRNKPSERWSDYDDDGIDPQKQAFQISNNGDLNVGTL